MRNPDRNPVASPWAIKSAPPGEEIPVLFPVGFTSPHEEIPTLLPADAVPTAAEIPTVFPFGTDGPAGKEAPRERWKWPGFWGAIRTVVRGIASTIEWCVGLVALFLFLSVLAA